MEDRQPVHGDHDAHPREGPDLAGLPRGRHRRAVGGPGPHRHLRGGLLLPVLPQGGLPRDRARRTALVVIAAILGAYLIGAIPVGWLVARAFGVGDIRRHGSGNIGATNVLRTLGRTPAIVTLLGDVAKGYAAVAIAERLAWPATAPVAAAAVAAVVGNCWSV